jgi:tetratricopeptide (TPR) repeat protein/SAM-dependent methyltransferase
MSAMNRKQRRVAGRSGEPTAPGSVSERPAPDSVSGLFRAAVAQHQAGALAEAERRYRHLLTLAPAHADSLHNLGLIALQNGNAMAAVELFESALRVNATSAEYHYNIALAWRALNRMDAVTTHLERAIALRNDHVLAHLNLGNVRREQGRLGEAAACYERVITLDPNSSAARFNLGNILSEQGRWDAAITCYRQAAALAPRHAETHRRLGVALMVQGNASEAILEFERALAENPDLPGAQADLAKTCMAAGRLEAALDAATRALERHDTPAHRALFAQCVRFARFTADDGRFRRQVLRALSEAWARPRDLAATCITLIKLNPVVSNGIAKAEAAWPARLSATELLGASGLVALSRDELLRCMLECDPLSDIGLERLVTNVRHIMMSMATAHAADDGLLDLCCAVARQCFVNEYVFAMTQTEAVAAARLRDALAQALAANSPCPALWPVAVGAYFPLGSLPSADVLLDRSWPPCVEALLVQQIKEPAQERRIAATIPALTGIAGDVSRAVREQYEESPYPRWVKAAPPAQPAIFADRRPEQAFEVLIAGCGTGLSSIEFARQAHAARIVAVDLSVASLSYAKRMADNFGLANIEFAQADIMQIAGIGRAFDAIDASGVLHHLADPWAGWRILLSLLRPGGVMQVILASNDPLLRSVTQWEDFFTTHECRDLLFNVQEHRITLREIKVFLADNGVQFAGFIQDASTMHRFAARFPDSAAMLDLDCWHTFETEAPSTFAAMYQFWVRKPGARLDQPPSSPS